MTVGNPFVTLGTPFSPISSIQVGASAGTPVGATSSIEHDPPVSIMETVVSMVEPALVIASPSMGPPGAFQVMRKAAPTPATMEEPTPDIVAAAAVALTASTQIPAPEEVVDGGDSGKSASSSGGNHGKKEKVKKRPRAFMTPKEEAAFHAGRKLKKLGHLVKKKKMPKD